MTFDDIARLIMVLLFFGGIAGALIGAVLYVASTRGRVVSLEDRMDDAETRIDNHASELKIVVRLDERMKALEASNQRQERWLSAIHGMMKARTGT